MRLIQCLYMPYTLIWRKWIWVEFTNYRKWYRMRDCVLMKLLSLVVLQVGLSQGPESAFLAHDSSHKPPSVIRQKASLSFSLICCGFMLFKTAPIYRRSKNLWEMYMKCFFYWLYQPSIQPFHEKAGLNLLTACIPFPNLPLYNPNSA